MLGKWGDASTLPTVGWHARRKLLKTVEVVPDEPNLHARPDAAHLLSISIRKLDQLMKTKMSWGVKVGKRTLIPHAELNASRAAALRRSRTEGRHAEKPVARVLRQLENVSEMTSGWTALAVLLTMTMQTPCPLAKAPDGGALIIAMPVASSRTSSRRWACGSAICSLTGGDRDEENSNRKQERGQKALP